jgi:shikimate dehydrogenase
MTGTYAEVIGDPIAQSKSPAIHGFWLDALGIAADYRATRVAPADLPAYIAARRADPDWRGCNVTMPHKQAVIALLDRLDPLAARVGAVNTIVREGEALVGYNTDVPGFLEPLRPLLDQPHLFRMARVLGTGGAARAVVTALAQTGVVLVHFATPTDFVFDDREGIFDLVVNATSLGMTGHAPLAFDLSHAPPGAVFYDIVTSPLETPLLRHARDAGFATIDGLAMLIGQADHAFRRFFGAQPPRADNDAALRARLV